MCSPLHTSGGGKGAHIVEGHHINTALPSSQVAAKAHASWGIVTKRTVCRYNTLALCSYSALLSHCSPSALPLLSLCSPSALSGPILRPDLPRGVRRHFSNVQTFH
jgi:hypothetical protein